MIASAPVRSTCLVVVLLARLAGVTPPARAADALVGPARPLPLPAGRIVDYTPGGFTPAAPAPPHPGSVAADAADLARLGVGTVVLEPGAALEDAVCPIFQSHGIAVVIAVTDPGGVDDAHVGTCAAGFVVAAALAPADHGALAATVARLRRAGGRPVGVRAPAAAFRADPALLGLGDWTMVGLEPFEAGHAHPQDACGWTLAAARELQSGAGEVPLLADVGLPTAGDALANEHYQRAFFACIESRGLRFSHREAVDQPWRGGPTAGRYGLFRDDGTPKRWAFQQLRPRLSLRVHAGRLRGRVRGAAPARFRVVVYAREGAGPWTPGPPLAPGRAGKWQAPAPARGEVAAVLVAPGVVPDEPVARLPQVDGEQVFGVSGAVSAP